MGAPAPVPFFLGKDERGWTRRKKENIIYHGIIWGGKAVSLIRGRAGLRARLTFSCVNGEALDHPGTGRKERTNRMEINGQTVKETGEYAQMGLSPEVMRAIEKKGYVQATPVQVGAIPYFMEWKDVIAKAPTGTGKTFAFGIPMVEHIRPEVGQVQALVLAPTRELAIQIQEELRDLCAFREGVRIVCLYGGQPID